LLVVILLGRDAGLWLTEDCGLFVVGQLEVCYGVVAGSLLGTEYVPAVLKGMEVN